MAGYTGERAGAVMSDGLPARRSADVAGATEAPQIHLKFAPHLVEQALQEAKAGDITQEEAAHMSSGVALMYRHVSRQWKGDMGEREKASREVGFALAHRVLRYAASDAGVELPTVRDETAEDFEAFMRKNPENLAPWFNRDYAAHDSVTELVNGFTNPHSQFGAQLVLGIHGRLANPTREPIKIPSREPSEAEMATVVLNPHATKTPDFVTQLTSSGDLSREAARSSRSSSRPSRPNKRRRR